MIACGVSVSTIAGVSRVVHASTERGPTPLETIDQVGSQKSSTIASPEFGDTNQTYILREEQGGSLRSQLALRTSGQATRGADHTICQLQLRYWISAPCSASFCLCKMALALSSESSAARVMLSRTGPMRGPTVVLGPPNHCAKPRGAAASTSTSVRSTWLLPTGDTPRGESLSESFPDMVVG